MTKILLRWVINAVAVWAAIIIVPGLQADGGWTVYLWMALILGLVNALIALADDRDIKHVSLMSHINGPDFPTGGQMLNTKVELRQIYEAGQGTIRVRGEYKLEHKKRGGTDIVACFMLGVPTLPVYAGQIQRPGLGVDLRVLDEAGDDVIGTPGELVCAQPLPSMPLYFLGDADFSRYEDAYFGVYEGLWRHGDLVERTREGGIVVYGRSDATLNPGGVRIGTAEIYRPLERLPEVVEAVAVGKRVGADQEVWLLVVLAPGAALDEALAGRIRDAVRRGASPRHVPRRVIDVPQLPRTRSGKAMELAVARLVNGQAVPNLEVMANPGSVALIEARLRELGLL